MTGYVRNDTANNIADGNVANASDLDGEFDALVDAFANTTGHKHDGSVSEGAPITVVGPAQDYVASASDFKPKTDSAYELGTTAQRWSAGYLDDLVLTNALPLDQGGTGATSASAARTSLGLGTAAITDATAYATAAQGALADTAVQPASTDILTNKTVNLTSNTLAGTTAQFNAALSDDDFATLTNSVTLTNKTLTAPAITAPTMTGTIIEDIFALTGTTPALEPANGSIQTWTLSGNSTPTDSLAAGEAITIMVDDGTAFTITWPSVTWVNNSGVAPALAATGYTVVVLWKVSTTLYGALVGNGG